MGIQPQTPKNSTKNKFVAALFALSFAFTAEAAPNWWSRGQTGGTFYPSNGGSYYPNNNGYNNGGTFVPSIPSSNGYYSDKSGQCPYNNDQGYGNGRLGFGGYGPRYNNCNYDYECPGQEKCCYYDSKKECAYPVVFV